MQAHKVEKKNVVTYGMASSEACEQFLGNVFSALNTEGRREQPRN